MLEAIFDDFVNGRLKSICGTLPFIEIATAHRAAMIRTCCAVHSPKYPIAPFGPIEIPVLLR